ncbi:MAG: hypothetical protein K6F86_04985 [Lachnospiraceae bacterium]|nr:hypothetical protein [Lachnospiraceae bacterium]
MKPLICSFSGVYEGQRITAVSDIVDFSDMRGCSMYVDEEAEKIILDRLSGHSFTGLHFIDNGNYHYMTRLFLSFVRDEFDLCLFDHHTDDKPPAFGGLKSCGSWVYDIRNENAFLRDLVHIRKKGDETGLFPGERPVYISVDKDVLSADVLHTNWDQGDMTKEEFFEIFTGIIKTRPVLGIDICGEDEPDKSRVENDAFNMEIIDTLRRSFSSVNGLFSPDSPWPLKA